MLKIRWIISYCLTYPRRYMYKKCIIHVIFLWFLLSNVKHTADMTYIIQLYNINIIQYIFYEVKVVSYWPDKPILTETLLYSPTRKQDCMGYYAHMRSVGNSSLTNDK